MNAATWQNDSATGTCRLPQPRHMPPLPPLHSGRTHTLHPGDVSCAENGDRLETLLGSCIAIILTDPRRTIGAMCHFVHSRPATSAARESTAHAGTALRKLYAMLRARGIEPTLCEAFVYGGGNMFPDIHTQGAVGDDNARWALDALARDGIKVLYHDVGGHSYRRVAWTVGSGMPDVVSVLV